MKKVWPIAVVIAAVLVCLYYADRAFQSGAKLGAAKKDYAELKKAMDADHEVQQGIIAGAEATIAEKDAAIVTLTGAAAVKDAEIVTLKASLHDLQNAEPPTTPDIEALPIVVNLRAQVSRLTGMFTLATAAIQDRDRIIAAWESKYNAQIDVSMAWKRQYENERALRIAAEEMFKLSERRRGAYSLATKAALVLGAAGVLYGLSK